MDTASFYAHAGSAPGSVRPCNEAGWSSYGTCRGCGKSHEDLLAEQCEALRNTTEYERAAHLLKILRTTDTSTCEHGTRRFGGTTCADCGATGLPADRDSDG